VRNRRFWKIPSRPDESASDGVDGTLCTLPDCTTCGDENGRARPKGNKNRVKEGRCQNLQIELTRTMALLTSGMVGPRLSAFSVACGCVCDSYEAASDALELEVLGDLSVEQNLHEVAAGHQKLGAQIDAV